MGTSAHEQQMWGPPTNPLLRGWAVRDPPWRIAGAAPTSGQSSPSALCRNCKPVLRKLETDGPASRLRDFKAESSSCEVFLVRPLCCFRSAGGISMWEGGISSWPALDEHWRRRGRVDVCIDVTTEAVSLRSSGGARLLYRGSVISGSLSPFAAEGRSFVCPARVPFRTRASDSVPVSGEVCSLAEVFPPVRLGRQKERCDSPCGRDEVGTASVDHGCKRWPSRTKRPGLPGAAKCRDGALSTQPRFRKNSRHCSAVDGGGGGGSGQGVKRGRDQPHTRRSRSPGSGRSGRDCAVGVPAVQGP